MHEHHITVSRTARYYTLGNVSSPAQLWFVLHGYGQLARRFLERFAPIDDGSRLIVAPESLSRYYLDEGVHGPEARVGGTWMTREDRQSEIQDYVAYLDALHERVTSSLGGKLEVRVLGFSQGAATASRWAVMGQSRLDRLWLWGGSLPPDLDLASAAPTLERLRLTFVLGRDDRYATPGHRAETAERLRAHGMELRLVEFDGGHGIEGATLQRIAAR